MIELRTLGSLELRAADGTEFGTVLSQPKRLVLLTYLAVTPGAFRRRDTLVGLFWPTLDQQRARAALRQAAYHLRRELGAGVLIGRGDELGVDPARLWCDVAAFREAVAERRYREALALYRGDLLSGVYLEGTVEAERWIEAERRKLRAEAAAAAWSLAEQAAGHDASKAAAWVRRVVELDPDHIIAWVHLAIMALKEGRLDEYEALSRRALELVGHGDYADYPLIVRIPRAFALDLPEDRDGIWEELEGANVFTLFWSFQVLTFLVEDLDAAARVAELMTASPHPAPVRLFGLLVRAELELAHGRWSRARECLDAAAHLDPAVATVHRALLALVDFREPVPDELHALRDELLRVASSRAAGDLPSDPWFDAHHAVLDAECTYALGLIHIRLGELTEAAVHIAALDALAAATPDLDRAAHARDAARRLRARIALRKGDAARALACLEGLELAAPMHAYFASCLYGRVHERFLRAELLARSGRDDEALTWLAALGDDSPHAFIYRAPTLHLRAEILERRGEHDRARTLRDRAEELWRDADPELGSEISRPQPLAAPSS